MTFYQRPKPTHPHDRDDLNDFFSPDSYNDPLNSAPSSSWLDSSPTTGTSTIRVNATDTNPSATDTANTNNNDNNNPTNPTDAMDSHLVECYPQRKKRRITMEDAFASLLSMSHQEQEEDGDNPFQNATNSSNYIHSSSPMVRARTNPSSADIMTPERDSYYSIHNNLSSLFESSHVLTPLMNTDPHPTTTTAGHTNAITMKKDHPVLIPTPISMPIQMQDHVVSKRLNFEDIKQEDWTTKLDESSSNLMMENHVLLPLSLESPVAQEHKHYLQQQLELQDMEEDDIQTTSSVTSIQSGADPMSTTSIHSSSSSSSSSSENELSLLFAPRKKSQQKKILDPVDERIEELIRHSRLKAMRMMDPMMTSGNEWNGGSLDESLMSKSSSSSTTTSSISSNRSGNSQSVQSINKGGGHKRKNAHMNFSF